MNWVVRIGLLIWALAQWDTPALQPPEYTLLLTATAEISPPKITIRWPVNIEARQIVVRRKSRESSDWGSPIATLAGNATQFIDTNAAAGQAYEYEFSARAGDGDNPPMAYGYICAGAGVTTPEFKGRAILIVDATHASALAAELDQYKRNLIGDGWTVVRRDVSPNDTPPHVRSLIQAEYNADPANTKAVILFGRIPVPYSGVIYPDLHWGHRGAWPADVYYGEMNGTWTDSVVWHDQTDEPANTNNPGDGKFDQSIIPTEVELEVGRVDLSNLPAFAPRTERDLLRNYLIKNHRFRHREFTLQARGLIRDEFGVIAGDAPAVDAWRAFPAMFGLMGLRAINSGQYFPTLQNEGYLFSYAGGGGDFTQAQGVGSTADFAANDPRCAFYMLHGSYFGDWNFEDNFLRAAIATPSYGLVSIWTSLPHWFFHRMAMGESVGSVVKLMQNDRARLYKTDWDWAVGEVHMSMMGDPTLRMHFVAPPRNLRVTPGGTTLTLQWDAPGEAVGGYNVYRADSIDGTFTRLNRTLVTQAALEAPMPAPGRHIYMVRAQAMQTTGSGSFQNYSEGAFAEFSSEAQVLPEITVRAVTAEAAEGTGALAFEFSRSGNAAGALAVNYQIEGAASAGTDFPAQSGAIQFAAGGSTANLEIPLLQDNVAEFSETVVVTIAANGAYTIGSPSAATGTISANGESRINSTRADGGTISFEAAGFANRAYRIESRAPGGAWRERRSGVAGANGIVTYSETTPANGVEFYRIVWE